MAETVALFPLNVVLFPGMPLPLHIFEPRYRQLVTDVAEPGRRKAFGVVAVGAGALPVSEIGTMAEIMTRQPYPDGRSDLLTVGSRRFRIRSLDPDARAYLQGDVEWLDEADGPGAAAALRVARALSDRYAALLARLGGAGDADGEGQQAEPVSDDPLRASYEIATRIQLDLAERQELLAAEHAAERLVLETALLRRELRIIPATRSVPAPAAAVRMTPHDN